MQCCWTIVQISHVAEFKEENGSIIIIAKKLKKYRQAMLLRLCGLEFLRHPRARCCSIAPLSLQLLINLFYCFAFREGDIDIIALNDIRERALIFLS